MRVRCFVKPTGQAPFRPDQEGGDALPVRSKEGPYDQRGRHPIPIYRQDMDSACNRRFVIFFSRVGTNLSNQRRVGRNGPLAFLSRRLERVWL